MKYRDKAYRETDLRLLRAVQKVGLRGRPRKAFAEFVKRVKRLGSMTVKERTWVARSAVRAIGRMMGR
jgi:hypothetical protein